MMGSVTLALALIGGLYSGMYALQSGTAATTATLQVTPLAGDRVRFDITVRRGGAIVNEFDLDMTKRMHVIVVSDDFRSFAHLHPLALANGHMVVEMPTPHGAYHVYADSEPHGVGQQVFRFDVGAGGAPSTTALRAYARDDKDTPATSVAAGPYVVRLSTLTLRAGRENRIALTIAKNGAPASDLQPYLGAAGHAVFLNVRDLTYVHVHPSVAGAAIAMHGMDMSDAAQTGPNLTLHVNVREPGTYKLWFEFRGGAVLYTAPFVVTVRYVSRLTVPVGRS
jgi:hypothetical protein